jgi:rhodanese-related sulfurtransferase
MTSSAFRSRRVGVATSSAALVLAAAAMLALPANSNASGSAPGQPHDARQLPVDKQTTLGLYLTAEEAYERWKAAPDKVTVLDVRTAEEYLFIGHAEMAWNVPLASQSLEWDAAKKQFPMVPLPDFVARVQKIAKPHDTLLVMCRSGGRSAMAVNALAKSGFDNVYNITDGFEGDAVKNPDSVFNGQRLVNGWRNSGLPWTYEVDPSRMVLPGQR